MSSIAQQATPPFAQRLRERRIRAGLSGRQLATLAGVSDTTIMRAERGVVPSPAVQVKVAGALGVDVFELWPLDEVAA